MKKPIAVLSLLCALSSSLVFADLQDDNQLLEPQTVSQALGHTFAKNLMDTPGFRFDIPAVVQGMQDALDGKPSPLTDAQYERAFDLIQQRYLDELSTANVSQADAFLNENIAQPNVVEVVPGKLQISVVEEGEGDVIKNEDSPVVTYTGKYLDDTKIETLDNEPITIEMQQAIPGLQKGLVGAKKGETRRLYIHPEFCHSSSEQSSLTEPLMILDVKILETNKERASSE